MMDDKKLKDSELEQVCGGDDGGTKLIRKFVVNPNGTDFCMEPTLLSVKKHLDCGTILRISGTVRGISKAFLESGELGYVLSSDLR